MSYTEKIKKLLQHANSARALGNVAEADAYKRKAVELERLAITKRAAQKISGKWKCSCGFLISLDIDAGELTQKLVDAQLNPHRGAGHFLVEIK